MGGAVNETQILMTGMMPEIDLAGAAVKKALDVTHNYLSDAKLEERNFKPTAFGYRVADARNIVDLVVEHNNTFKHIFFCC